MTTEPLPAASNRSDWLRLLVPSLSDPAQPGFHAGGLLGDIYGGLTAAVVALPLALAFGVASGAGAIAGLYGAIAVGFFAAIFGGTPAQVSGPTGPMTVVMGAIVATHASNLAEAFTIVMLGGAIQIVFGFMRLGRYITYTPYSVVSGFMTGIGVIIMLIQVLPFLGLPTSTGGVIGTLQTLARLDASTIDWRAFTFAAAALALITLWPAQLARFLPAPLAALAIGTALSAFVITGLPEIGQVPTGLPSFIVPVFSLDSAPQIVQAAFVLAVLGSIDSLLTSLIADSITRTQHDSDKELVGQGIGNLLSGLIGGLPGAGATMRTVVNVRAGGRSPISGALHAVVLLALALGLGPVVAHVPHAVLAAILMKVGWDIIDWSYLKFVRHAPREKFVIMLITFALTVLVDLITAVTVGIVLSSFVNSRWLAIEQLKGLKQTADGEELDQLSAQEKELLRSANGKVLVSLLQGSFSYASARELARRASPALTGHEVVIYDFSHVGYIDTSAAMAIDEVIVLSLSNNQTVLVSGLQGHASRALNGLGVLKRIPAAQRFDSCRQAIEAAAAHFIAPDGPQAA
jgi:SulP family sulfate permease